MIRTDKGFTLIEVLVVVSILGVLMGLVSVLVLRAGSHRQEQETKQLIKTYLPNSIERYYQELKKLPPMTLKGLNLASQRWKAVAFGDSNETNMSAECLLVALRHPDLTAPLGDGDLPVSDAYGNTDEDSFNMVPDGSDSADAKEILDSWGNPIVYIDKSRYGETFTIVNAQGEEVEVVALRRDDGQWYNKTKYQLISVGPNGKQDLDDPEASDDIVNFSRDS